MLLTLMAQNMSHGGLRNEAGDAENRIPSLLSRVKSVKPTIDILLLSEAEDWDRYAFKHLVTAMNELQMDSLPLSKPSTGFPVGVLYKPQTVGSWQSWDTKFSEETTHGFGVAAFEVGLPKLLSIVPVHINPFSKEKALSEVGLIASRGYRNGPYVVLGGDVNFPPNDGFEPDYETMRPYNKAVRTEFVNSSPSQKPQADRRIAKSLERYGYVDVALELYHKDRDTSKLAITAGEYRIDQFWVSQALAPGIVDYWTVDTPINASDHKGIVFQLDTDLIDTSDAWGWR